MYIKTLQKLLYDYLQNGLPDSDNHKLTFCLPEKHIQIFEVVHGGQRVSLYQAVPCFSEDLTSLARIKDAEDVDGSFQTGGGEEGIRP